MTSTPKKPRKSSTVVAKTPRKSKAAPALPPNPFVHEILEYVGKQKSKVAKVQALKEYRNDALVSILIWNFDETVVSLMPEGDVPFTPNDAPAGTEHTRLVHEFKGLYRFFKGGDSSIKGMRREQLFVQLLEGLHADEAKMLVSACNKDLQSKYRITKAVVADAFPQIEWGNRG